MYDVIFTTTLFSKFTTIVGVVAGLNIKKNPHWPPGPVDQSFAGPFYIFTGPERNIIGVIGKGQKSRKIYAAPML